ncbi:LLM class flavin-dependent oxidoreductase [Neorhizobium sp. DAR64872/K0K18]|uniref:LLM class flavin-dependent oxidoreductase n=1 Tax=Neorhizobium sp. DAR64872/K0K18 TaxID=3421958 RepID=UPI003D2AD3F0
MMVAKAAASVDQPSGGRVILGVASGDRPVEYPLLGLDFEKRGDAFREAVAYLRDPWKNEDSLSARAGSSRGYIYFPSRCKPASPWSLLAKAASLRSGSRKTWTGVLSILTDLTRLPPKPAAGHLIEDAGAAQSLLPSVAHVAIANLTLLDELLGTGRDIKKQRYGQRPFVPGPDFRDKGSCTCSTTAWSEDGLVGYGPRDVSICYHRRSKFGLGHCSPIRLPRA